MSKITLIRLGQRDQPIRLGHVLIPNGLEIRVNNQVITYVAGQVDETVLDHTICLARAECKQKKVSIPPLHPYVLKTVVQYYPEYHSLEVYRRYRLWVLARFREQLVLDYPPS
jgi:hypothetical protein